MIFLNGKRNIATIVSHIMVTKDRNDAGAAQYRLYVDIMCPGI